jgi:xanthine dehydrogenase accessory factor
MLIRMTIYGRFPPRLAIVLGCGDLGSAVAVVLHRAGFAVALVDEADPSWHRRGMTFTNAWYVGNAELDGEGACFCASLKSVPSILARRMIAATTWSWQGLAAAFETSLLVDARGRKRRGLDSLSSRVPIAIDAELGIAEADAHEPSSTIEARRHGRFMTERRIGDTVREGEIVGAVGNDAVQAPARGVLLGLAARGARIEPGDTVVEVDTVRPKHACYGIADDSRSTALRVLAECRIRLGSSSCCNTAPSRFESLVTHEEYPQ